MERLHIDQVLYGKKNEKEFVEDIFPTRYWEINNQRSDLSSHYYSIFHYIDLKGYSYPRQGWKVHVSCTRYNFQKVLDIVCEFCLYHNISFKYIYNKTELMYCLSGSGSPLQLGKFITIYPISNAQFSFIVKSLFEKLKGFKGPYVLSDKRYNNSNIYYRFGVIDSTSDFLVTPDGGRIPDNRKYFEVPYFERDPFPDANDANRNNKTNHIGKYIFPKVIIHTASAGNIYQVSYEGNVVILKESRPFVTGFWGSAIEDLKNEINILNVLKDIPGIPKIYEDFSEWENYYLVQEYIDGSTFAEIRADLNIHYDVPFMKIIKESITLLQNIHKKGIILNDISSGNFIICRDRTPHVWICDFGSAFKYDRITLLDYEFGATKGFYDEGIAFLSPFNSDYHKLGYLLMNYIFPSNKLNILGNGKDTMEQFTMYCRDNNISQGVIKIINLLINQPHGWKGEIKDILKHKSNNTIFSCEKSSDEPKIKKRESLIKELKNFREQLTSSFEFVKRNFHDDYFITDPGYDFFNISNGLFVPLGVSSMNQSKDKKPENLNLGGFENSNLGFLFDEILKQEFFSKINLHDKKIKDWITSSNDFTISTGVLGLGAILMLCDTKNEIQEIDEYILLIKDKVETKEFRSEKGEILGISDGYLGVALFDILRYQRTNNINSLQKALNIIELVKEQILNKKNDLLFPTKIGGRFSSPYLYDGLAGFLYLGLKLYLCKDLTCGTKCWLKNSVIFPVINSLREEKWAQNVGLFDGLTGISYTLFLAGITFDINDLIDESLLMLLNVKTFSFSLNDKIYIPDKECQNVSFDLKSGSTGIVYVLNNTLWHLNEVDL